MKRLLSIIKDNNLGNLNMKFIFYRSCTMTYSAELALSISSTRLNAGLLMEHNGIQVHQN